MTQNAHTAPAAPSWEREIRALEERTRIAFLQGDTEALNLLWADGYVVNSPLDRVHHKDQVLELLEAGKIRHSAYECEIEHISRHGEVAIVMGNDRVDGPPEGLIVRRRYTNVWVREDGQWRTIARHAHVVSREAAG